MIILDFDARRLIKRQKQFHPRPGPLREAGEPLGGSQLGASTQHVGKAGGRNFHGMVTSRRSRGNGDMSGPAYVITPSEKADMIGGGAGPPERRTNVGMVGTDPEINPGEVCVESSSPSLLG